ncbi:MAG: hypothetical protein IJV98_00455 [Clostridia bacterium]|nr:hypothetical protein [Clostridia bacterium]
MLDILMTPVFWLAIASAAILYFGMAMLKKYLKKLSFRLSEKAILRAMR